MGAACCAHEVEARTAAVRRVLWIVLAVNAVMFVVEGVAGLFARSASLQADALDFLGDAATYAVSLLVLSRSLRWRAGAGMAKGVLMALMSCGIFIAAAAHATTPGAPPAAATMGVVGLVALTANIMCAALLYRYRSAESNLRSAWLCSRTDALNNVAVLAAAAGVWGTASSWPDLVVGAGLATLVLFSAAQVMHQALAELTVARARAHT